MAGYHGYSKSNNAVDAEVAGRYPLTKASQVLAKKLGWPIAKAKAFLKDVVATDEYHHTSSWYNITNYYDVSDSAIQEMADEISGFLYEPEKKKTTTTWFKCWNIHDDPRRWDWKFTRREGNNCYTLECAGRALLRPRCFATSGDLRRHYPRAGPVPPRITRTVSACLQDQVQPYEGWFRPASNSSHAAAHF